MGPTLPHIKNDFADEDHQQFTGLDWNELQVSSAGEIAAEGSISWSQRSMYEVGVRWSPACKDVSPEEGEERPPSKAPTKQREQGRYFLCHNDLWSVVTSWK
jgi:hypothetical protein